MRSLARKLFIVALVAIGAVTAFVTMGPAQAGVVEEQCQCGGAICELATKELITNITKKPDLVLENPDYPAWVEDAIKKVTGTTNNNITIKKPATVDAAIDEILKAFKAKKGKVNVLIANHGSSGNQQLGDDDEADNTIGNATAATKKAEARFVEKLKGKIKNLDLTGCQTGAGAKGKAFVKRLRKDLKADQVRAWQHTTEWQRAGSAANQWGLYSVGDADDKETALVLLPSGNLSGIYDVHVHTGDKSASLYHCIARLDHDGATNDVEASLQCYTDVDISDPNAEPLNPVPGEGPGDLVPGPPPPGPYSPAAPSVLAGSYNSGTDTLTLAGCFANVGGIAGPNLVAQGTITNAKADLPSGVLHGTALVYTNQSLDDCQYNTPPGSPPAAVSINLYKAGSAGQAPWRSNSVDFDGDGCSDSDELDPANRFKCGDDPYNPHDPTSGIPIDVSGSYEIISTAALADWDTGLNQLIPGFFYTCNADIQQVSKNVTARVYCYTDAPGITVNKQAANGNATCPPAPQESCGDGLSGAAPPGRTVANGARLFGDVDDQHAVLTGVIDNTTNSIEIAGCFEDRDGNGPFGHIYVEAVVELHTGVGVAEIWPAQQIGDCTGNNPQGLSSAVPFNVVRLAPKSANRDSDSDGCPDKAELGDNEMAGGLRDPWNHYDYFNPTNDGVNRVDDILAVVGQYFNDDPDPNNPDLKSKTDRTAIVGGNAWNVGPPNGLQRVDDILAAVKQYFHDC